MSEHATTVITATWHAASAAELREISGWVHDAHLQWEAIGFDRETAAVTPPFQQEADRRALRRAVVAGVASDRIWRDTD